MVASGLAFGRRPFHRRRQSTTCADVDRNVWRAKIWSMRITRRQFATGIAGATAGIFVFGDVGCSEGTSDAAVSDVILEGGATEAGALALVDAPLLTDATQAASFT